MLNVKKTLTKILESLTTILESLKDPTVVCSGGDESVSLANNTMTQIPLVATNTLYNNTDDVALDTSLKGLKIKTSGLYKIQGSVYLSVFATGTQNVGCFIRKASNGGAYASASEIAGATLGKPSTGDVTAHTPMKIYQLSADDVIYLVARSTGGTASVYGSNQSTFLYIEKVYKSA